LIFLVPCRKKPQVLQNAHLLRCAAAFVTAAYVKVRLIPQALRALHPSIFEQPPIQGVFQCPAKGLDGESP
jgi:hypothetical protein